MSSVILPEFKTARLILRGVTHADIPSYQKYFADYDIIGPLASGVPWPYPENGVQEFLDNTIFPVQGIDQWLWGIFEKNNPSEVIGAVHLWRDGHPENRGFWLAKPFWGKGYMTEAVEPVMSYAFNDLGFETLYFANAIENKKSRRVKEKTGARYMYIKAMKFVDPKYTATEIWELKKAEWFAHLAARGQNLK